MERIRKGSDLPKKVGVTEHKTKIFAHQAPYFVEFSTPGVCALENDVARACLMNSVRSNNGRDCP